MSKMLIIFMCCLPLTVYATSEENLKKQNVEVINPWVRLLPGKMSTGVFMEIKNVTDKDLYLVKASSSIAKTVELHDHVKVDGLLKMQAIEKILIPEKSSVHLKKGSLHIMLIDLTTELKKDSIVQLLLEFSDGSRVNTKARVLTDL